MSGSCQQCGEALTPGDAFCAQCGTPTRNATPMPPRPPSVTPRQRRTKRRRWFQLPLLVVSLVLLVLIGSVGGYFLYQAGSTVATIHQLSTPAPSVSINVLLDDSNADTGGSTVAQTTGEDANAQINADADVTTTTGGANTRISSRVNPSGRGSASSGGEVRSASGSDNAAAPGNDPSSAPGSASTGGGAATTVPASDADAGGGSATDADATTEQASGGTTQIDTGPAMRSLESDPRYAGYGQDEGGTFDGVQEVASGLGGGVAEVTGAGDSTVPTEPINILLMGVDARPGESIDIAVRPDALAVLRLDPVTSSCRMLAIPRDTRVELLGYGQSKINHALAVGGVPYQMQVVERYLGIQLDHYGLIDFSGIVQLVDSVGGVTITIPETYTASGVTFAAGTQTLNGEETLAYARYRGGSDGDFGRIRRQQQILGALITELGGLDATRAANDLMPALKDHTRTDQTPSGVVDLASAYRGKCTEASTGMENLEGATGTFPDPLLNLNLSYVLIDETEKHAKVAWLLEA